MTPPITEAAAERLPEARRLPVFASADGRRGRALGLVGRVAAGLTLFWLAALLAGAMGLGHLPGVPLPKSEEGGVAPAAPHTGGSAAQPADGPARTTTGSHRHGGTVHSSASRSSAGRDSGIAAPPRGRVGAGNSARRDRLPQPRGLGRAPAGTPASSTAPGLSGTDPGSTQGGSHGTAGPSAPTYNPGTNHASPTPSATEHSHGWGSADG